MGKAVPHLEWFDVSDPHSAELDALARRFGLHELQVEDCRDRPHGAKAEDHDRYLFTVVKAVRRGGESGFDDVDLFLGRDFLISVRAAGPTALDHVRQRVEQERVDRLDRVFYLILDRLVDEYQPVLDRLAEDISAIEEAVLDRPDPPTLARIFALRRQLVDFRRVATSMREVTTALTRRETGLLGRDLDLYFRDIYDHVVRTVELIETDRDLLSGALDIYLSAVSNRTNQVMKGLTIWGTVTLPLVILTGFFGMNLRLPWADDPNGVWYAVGLMAASTAAVLAYFKARRWL